MHTIINRIFNCEDFMALHATPNVNNSCNEIVGFQRDIGIIQHPEPFSGNIKYAPVLVVSSNPSVSVNELYPDRTWPINIVHDFFLNRFTDRGVLHSWVYENSCLLTSGLRDGKNTTWTEIQKNISRLIERDAIPGIDYAFADIVHCKSKNNKGVNKACSTCVKKYFDDLILVANPCLIVAVGAAARDHFNTTYNTISYYNGIPVVCSPAPGASITRDFNKAFTAEELNLLKDILNKCPRNDALDEYVPANLDEVKAFIDLKIQEQ